MRAFRFKSLTMRIWATFTVVILLITLCMTGIYLIFFRYMDTRVKTQDLVDTHAYIMQSDFSDPAQFDAIRSLRWASHFIYSDGSLSELARPPMGGQPGRLPASNPAGGNQPLPNVGNGNPSPPHMGGANQQPPFDNTAVRNWILGYAVGELHGKSFHQKYDGIGFIFAISLLDDGSYFISYMPNIYDNNTMYYLLLISGLFILVGFAAARIIANNISKPLSELENFTMKIAEKDWKEPIALKNKDEIGRLAISMNKMQEALKRADEDEKTFLQSISHDFKTPVMVIMSHADAIIDGVYVDTLDKTAGIIKDEAIRLNKRIKQLLYLNTLDYLLVNQSETAAIELDAAVRQIMQKFEPLGNNLAWGADIEPARVLGDKEKLTVAIENILDNALRYAKTEISVSVKKNKDSVNIEIFNDGDPIKPEDRDRIFQSLYRDKKGNFGLGLAITKKIIEHSGGKVYVDNRDKGVSFIIDYPLPCN